MIIRYKIDGRNYTSDLTRRYDISIPLVFNNPQPNTYDLPLATSKAWEQDGFVGDTRRGGSCNFDEVRLVPHCNGTHTECVGHISEERISILDSLRETLVPATLITVQPELSEGCLETYIPALDVKDLVITRHALESALVNCSDHFLGALIIRTLPNDDSKLTQRYSQQPPPFFTIEAMRFLKRKMVRHLLVDIPSLDRTFDEGKLTAHHIYWNIEESSHEVIPEFHSLNTVTEFIYVPNKILDGKYLVNLQIAPFALDATPSRPVLFAVQPE